MLSKENASKDDCIKSIQYLNNMREIDNSKYYYNSIYMTNNENIFIVFIYEDILIINVKTLDIYKEKDIIKSIIRISEELNNKEFFYQFIHICPNNSYQIINRKEQFRERMNLPIGTSSIGITGTKEIKKQVEFLNKYFII